MHMRVSRRKQDTAARINVCLTIFICRLMVVGLEWMLADSLSIADREAWMSREEWSLYDGKVQKFFFFLTEEDPHTYPNQKYSNTDQHIWVTRDWIGNHLKWKGEVTDVCGNVVHGGIENVDLKCVYSCFLLTPWDSFGMSFIPFTLFTLKERTVTQPTQELLCKETYWWFCMF